jgi:hypothetical protein
VKLTTAFEARRRIVALLTANPAVGGDGVRVQRGGPTSRIELDTDMVYFASGVSDSSAELPAIGAQRRDDTYLLPLSVYVFRGGNDEAGTEDRCETICDAVVTALFGDLRLGDALPEQNHPGGLLVQALEIERFEITTQPVGEPGGWRSTAELSIRCRSFLLTP